MKNYLIISLFVFGLGTVCTTGRADIPAGTFRPHLDTTFMVFSHENEDPDSGGPEIETNNFAIGFGNPRIGIGFGATVIDNLVIGGRLTLFIDHTDVDDGDYEDTVFAWGVLPYVEYVFLDDMFRPFVLGTLGFEGHVGSVDGSGFNENDYSRFGFVFGGGGGAHLFLTDAFSFDGTFLLTYSIGQRKSEEVFADYESTVGVFQLALFVGLSGWF